MPDNTKHGKIRVLMTGVDPATRGGMWTVASGYLGSKDYRAAIDVEYVATSTEYSAPAPVKLVRAIASVSHVRRMIRSGHFDLVHVHMAERGSYFRGAAVVSAANDAGMPIVLHMHGGLFKDFFDASSPYIRSRIIATLRMASVVIVLGERFAEMFRMLGVDSECITILPNGVEVPSRNNYDPDAPDVTYLGLISTDKGIPEYFDAIAELSDECIAGRRFVLFGPEGNLDTEAEIANHGIEGLASYGGFLGPNERDAELARSCALILPSHFEVFPMCVIEAMAHGVPVVSTRVGAVEDAVEDGVNGLLVPPADATAFRCALEHLLGNRELRVQLSEAAFCTAYERYSIEAHVRKLLTVYRGLLVDNGGGR